MHKIKLNDKLYRVFNAEIKTVDTENFTLEAIFSTAQEDRHGDVVLQDGWDLKKFKKNPVILNSHNYGDASEVIGKAPNAKVVDGKLQGKITFAVNENPKAKIIFDLYAGGYLSAFSVGFIVKKFYEDDKGTDYFKIAEAELLEVSAVSVPANAYALAKSKGIDVEALGDPEEDEQDLGEDLEDEFGDEAKSCDICEKRRQAKIAREVEAKEKEAKNQAEAEAKALEEAELKKQEEEKIEEKTVEPEVKPKAEPYIKKVLRAIDNIQVEQKQSLARAAKIIHSLLEDEVETKNLEDNTKEQIKKRKVNQAIRELLKSK